MKDNLRLTHDQIVQLRETETDLLKIFISVCDKLQLKYFAVEGTLLGAVRHQGFIPWDDDIDVGMLREDYEAFVRMAPALLPEGTFLQTHSTDPAYPQCFAKLRNSKTTFVETTCQNLKMNHGIYIDIFPFDSYPDGKIQGLWFDFQKLLIQYRIREVYYLPDDAKPTLQNFIRKGATLLAKCRYQTVEDALQHRERLLRKYHHTARLINNGSPWKNRERVPSAWLSELTTLSFEGISIAAPAAYDRYLTHVYGNYMQLPPPEQRMPHHYLTAIGFE